MATEAPASIDPAHERFDLAMAVLLAGASFTAYLVPVGAEGFEDTTLSGSTTTFTQLDFLKRVYKGFLFVQDISATNLSAMDFLGKSDPYVVLSVGSSAGRTSVKSQELNPVYTDEQACLYVQDPETALLKIRVFDEDKLSSDDDLGYAMFPLKAVIDSTDTYKLDLPLEGKDAGEGRIQMRLTYVPFTDFDDEMQRLMVAMDKTAPEGGGSSLTSQAPALMEAMIRGSIAKRQGNGSDVASTINAGINEVEKALNSRIAMFKDVTGKQTQTGALTKPWELLSEVFAEQCAGYEPLAFVEDLESDTQAWLYANEGRKTVVIAFRGTEQVKWKDLATDINLVPTSLNPERIDDDKGEMLIARIVKSALKPGDTTMVHAGFLAAYDSVRQQLVRLLDAVTGTGENGEWRVLVTGHSLGGALATLCAFELAQRQGPAAKAQNVSMYTFGAPRVGNHNFVKQFDQLVTDSWRITNQSDIVPSVPRLLGYAHVKHSVSLDPSGGLAIEGGGKDVFGEGKAGADVIQGLVDKIQAEEVLMEEVFDEIASHELEILDGLVGGVALEQHMEDFYLETLRACVNKSIQDSGSE